MDLTSKRASPFSSQIHRTSWLSLPAKVVVAEHYTAQVAATLIRGHWEIENSLHWSLDVVMNDDQHRARKDNAPANFAALRRIALGIIKTNTAKGSNRVKFKKAGWSNDFLRSLIEGF